MAVVMEHDSQTCCLPKDVASVPSLSAISKTIAELTVHGTFESPNELATLYAQLLNSITAAEGIICAGKTTFLKLVEAYFREKIGLECRVLTESPDDELLKLFYADMSRYAFAMQVDMLRQRQAVNDASTAIAGRSNRYGNSSGRPCVVWNDRSLWGDAVFATVNYKLGNMNTAEFRTYRSILASHGPYRYDRIVFFDVDANRAHFLNQEHRKKPSEKGIPLSYFQQLRLAYYLQLRQQALTRGAKIIYIFNEPFCEVEHVLRKMIDAPSNALVCEIFEKAPDLKDDATPEAVSVAFSQIRVAYDAYYASKKPSM